MQEKLPHNLIMPTKLGEILQHTSEILYQIEPNYVFTYDQIEQHYRLNDIKVAVLDNSLVIQINAIISNRSSMGSFQY